MTGPVTCKSCILLFGVAATILLPAIAHCRTTQTPIIRKSPQALRPTLVLQRGHSSKVDTFAFSPDDRLLATGGQDHTVRTWNVNTGQFLYSLVGGGYPCKLAFSPDSKMLAAYIHRDQVQIRDAQTGTLLRTLDCGGDPGEIAFSPDNSTIACGSGNGSITLWNYLTGKHLRSMKAHVGMTGVGVLAFSWDGRMVASSEGQLIPDSRAPVELWNVTTGAWIASIQPAEEVHSLAFAPDNKTLAIGAGSWIQAHPAIELWDLKTRAIRQRLLGHKYDIVSLEFSKDGTHISSGDSQGVFIQWDRASGKALRSFGHHHPWENVAVSPDSRLAAESEDDGSVRIFDSSSGNPLTDLPGDQHQFHQLAFMADGQTLAVSTGSGSPQNDSPEKPVGEIHFWDVRTGAWKGALTGMPGTCDLLAISRDGKIIATAGRDGIVLLWNQESRSYLGQTGVQSDRIRSLALNADGSILVIAGEKPKPKGARTDPRRRGSDSDPMLDLWDTGTRTRIRSLQGLTSPINSVAFSADGSTLYSLGYDSRLILRNPHTGEIRKTISTDRMNESFAIDRAESMTAVSGFSSSIKSFDLRTGKLIHTYDTNDLAHQAAISPNGRVVAADDSQGAVWLWQTATGKLLHRLKGANPVKSLQFSPDNRTVATVDGESVVKLWEIDTGRLKARFTILGGSGPDSAWITYTPEGYYEGSPGIEHYIHWSINGASFPASRFLSQFGQPSHVQTTLSGAGQTSLFAQQTAHEAELRSLIRNQKVVVQRDQDAGTQRPDPGAKYSGKDSDLYQLLSNCLCEGDKPMTERLHKQIMEQIAAGASPNVQGYDGISALMFMAWYGDREAIEDLLKRGANINAIDTKGRTPLLHAASRKNKNIAQLLLDRGADIKDSDGASLLKLAGDKMALGRALIAILQPHGRSSAPDEPRFDVEDVVWMLLYLGANPNLRDNERRTPLILLTANQFSTQVLAVLLEKGVDVNAVDRQGDSALINAVRAGQTEVVRLLLAHGAHTHDPAENVSKALVGEAYGGHTEIVRLLLDHGADPNVSFGKEDGRTALMMAVQQGHTDIVKLLLAHGAHINTTAVYNHWSALTFAVAAGDAELVKLLLTRGASVNVRTKAGLTLIQLVKNLREQANDSFGIIALLKKAGERG